VPEKESKIQQKTFFFKNGFFVTTSNDVKKNISKNVEKFRENVCLP